MGDESLEAGRRVEGRRCPGRGVALAGQRHVTPSPSLGVSVAANRSAGVQ